MSLGARGRQESRARTRDERSQRDRDCARRLQAQIVFRRSASPATRREVEVQAQRSQDILTTGDIDHDETTSITRHEAETQSQGRQDAQATDDCGELRTPPREQRHRALDSVDECHSGFSSDVSNPFRRDARGGCDNEPQYLDAL